MTPLLCLFVLTLSVVRYTHATYIVIIATCGHLESISGITQALINEKYYIDFYIPIACKYKINQNQQQGILKYLNIIAIDIPNVSQSIVEIDWEYNDFKNMYDKPSIAKQSIIKHELNQTFYIAQYIMETQYETQQNTKKIDIVISGPYNYLITDLCQYLNATNIMIHSDWSIPIQFPNIQWNPTINSVNTDPTLTQKIKHLFWYYISPFVLDGPIIFELNRMQTLLNLKATHSIRNDYFVNQYHFIQSTSPISTVVSSSEMTKQLGILTVSKSNSNCKLIAIQDSAVNDNILEWIDNGVEQVIFVSFGKYMRSIKFEHYLLIMQSFINYYKSENVLEFRVVFILPGYHIFQLNAHFSEFMANVDQNKWNYFMKLEKECDDNVVLQNSKVSIFVNNADSLSVSSALVSKIPMILLPQWGDDFINCNKLKQLNCAMVLDQNKMGENPNLLFLSVKTMLLEFDIWKDNVNNISELIEQNGGLSKAVQFITQLTAMDKRSRHNKDEL